MNLKADDNHKYKNTHTSELFESVAIPTGFEKIYQIVEDVNEAEENITNENNSLSDRLSALEGIVDEIIKILSITEIGDNK